MKMRKFKKVEKKKQRDQSTVVDGLSGSNGEVLDFELKELIKEEAPEQLSEPFSEIELKITKLSSTGDGLALSESGRHIYAVPFSIPGDTVLAKVVSHFPANKYSHADFLKVIKPSPERDDSLVNCKYFSKCSGCQLQMVSYENQLKYKQNVVENAYRYFSQLTSDAIPVIEPTHGSPLKYGYRTKLTPHFDAFYRKRTADGKLKWAEIPPIGFTIEGMKKTMDIEECPIGTEIINKGLTVERERVKREIESFRQGATLLLRESTKRIPKDTDQPNGHTEATPKQKPSERESKPQPLQKEYEALQSPSSNAPTISVDHPTHTDIKTCITSHNALSTEYIDSYTFTNTAGAFFQNNNSILGPFTTYIRSLCLFPPPSPTAPSFPSQTSAHSSHSSFPKISYLLDAYCGSGLFAITLASLFRATLGIDIDERGIIAARKNAELNAPLIQSQTHSSSDSSSTSPSSSSSSPPSIGFIHADAARLFADVPFPPSETMVVIDPPRKGCSLDFLRQLRRFAPRRVVYVSCNVHSQARDVGWLVRGEAEEGEKEEGKVTKYRIERLAGWDFFPQTAHVEGVALLEKVDG